MNDNETPIELTAEHEREIECLAAERNCSFETMLEAVLWLGIYAVVRNLKSGALTKEELAFRIRSIGEDGVSVRTNGANHK